MKISILATVALFFACSQAAPVGSTSSVSDASGSLTTTNIVARALKPSGSGGSSNDGPSDDFLALLVLEANAETSSTVFRNAKFVLDQAQAHFNVADADLSAYLKKHPGAKPESDKQLAGLVRGLEVANFNLKESKTNYEESKKEAEKDAKALEDFKKTHPNL
ncbi:hypothetical protein BASA50_006929 [Batrachochytrium salamandrivorans]|uniref:Uncharacterized protein n=1 Tax=Batrachochytrium salamandrivorans TaxID=1357716 RepID=A0ABQ8F8H4_9FUNG|nr:hypothetical protein BASA50_006929 [Batrachochytrium salamandrivorans]